MPLSIPAPRNEGYTRVSATALLYWASWGPTVDSSLLVLHGGPGADQRYLQPQMLHLAEQRHATFYDQRGGGRSPSSDVITWRTQVDDLAHVVGEWGMDPPSIVGFSWGALLALLAAGTGAVRPRRLVLIDPAPITRQYRAEFEANMAARQEAVAPERETLRQSGLAATDPDAYRQRAFELSVAGYFANPARAHDLTPFRVMGRVQQSVWESLADYDIRPQLSNIHCPALVVHGRQDPVPLASSEDVAWDLGAELVAIDDCGHVPYVEQPAALFTAVDRFLDATEADP
ncbi:MAG TPA: alpha/beta hydrolase [Gemmatimonadaceae bacterium]|nr:alpha/beta hydrolase [Gemmatimonadaceae bacterium]